jgi:adenylate cyclase
MQVWLELPDGQIRWLGARCTIGREASNDLVWAHDALSRHHALIASDPQGCTLTDLRSRNGTFCNGRAVLRPQLLHDGDVIRCGDIELRFRCLVRHDTGAGVSDGTTRLISQIDVREVWLLLLDIEGYSGLVATLGNAAAVARVQDWIVALRPLIEGNGGTINRYLGDAIFAYWTAAPAANDRFAAGLRACVAARASVGVRFRIVAHRGNVAFTHSDHGEELGGQAVNFLFRSEKAAKACGASVLLSASVAEALDWTATARAVEGVTLDGIEGRFTFFDGSHLSFEK